MTANPEPGADARSELLQAAVRLLDEHGPQALRARRVTAEIGASTMALYSRFGGLGQLVDAIADYGFDRLARAEERVSVTADPVADILRLGLAYRRFAVERGHLYGVMFGLTAPGGHRARPPRAGGGRSAPRPRAYERLVDGVRRAIDAERFEPAQPEEVAAQFWTALHGYVTLELGGIYPPDYGLPHVLRPMIVNVCVGLGDTRTAVEASMATAERDLPDDPS